jgi:hypothetical protein
METIVSPNPAHQHHWVIETANGPSSEGVCKLCQAHRRFPNWLPDVDFRRDDRDGFRRAAERSL